MATRTSYDPGAADIRELRQGPSYLEVAQRIDRQWAFWLDGAEYKVLMRIVDITLGWQLKQARVPIAKLLDGNGMYVPLGIARSTLFDALKKLEEKKFIRRELPAGGTKRSTKSYSVNVDWSPSFLPENLRKGWSETRTTKSERRTKQVRNLDTSERTSGKEPSESKPYGSASPRPVLRLLVSEEEVGSAPPRPADNGTRNYTPVQAKVAAVEASWRGAVSATFPATSCISWTVRERAKVKGKLQTWIVADGSLAEFVDWAVRNWRAIIRSKFKWMTRSPPPSIPEIGFFLSFMGDFLACRAEGDLEKWLTRPERTEFEKLTAAGLSSEEAAAEIGRRRATEGMREENETIRIEARARVRQAQIIHKQTMAAASMPVHPQSRVAQEARRAANPLPAPTVFKNDEERRASLLNAPRLDPNWEPPL